MIQTTIISAKRLIKYRYLLHGSKFIIAILAILFTFYSCTEKINIDLGSTYTRLVVEGVITPQEGEQFIRLTKTTDYYSGQKPPTVSGAEVTVDNGNFIIPFVEDTNNLGNYFAPKDFVGVPGITYKLSVKLSESINGSSDYYAEEKMPQLANSIDSIVIEYNPNFEGWMVRLYAWDPPTTDFYMFRGMRNGKLINDTISKVNISDDRLYNGNYTAGAVVLVLRGKYLNVGDNFTLILSNITEEYANFILELQDEIRPNDPMFSGPPANVSSNVNNDAAGYFAAFPSAYSSTIVKEVSQ